MRSAAMTATASAAFHGVGVMTVVTPLAASSQTRVMDPTWANGRGDSRRSPGSDSTSVPCGHGRAGCRGRRRHPWAGPWSHWSTPRRPGPTGGGRATPSAAAPSAAATQSARASDRSGRAGRWLESVVDDRHDRAGALHDGGHLGGAEAQVDPGGDGPQPGDGRVADHVVDRTGQEQAHDGAGCHPVGGEQPGHPVGGTVPLGERQRPARPVGGGRLDVGLDVGVDPGGGAQDVDQRGVLPLDLTRRHIEGDCTSAPPGGPPDRKDRVGPRSGEGRGLSGARR